MWEDVDERDQLPPEEIEYPRTVHAAGVIWIVFGCLILLNGAASFMLSLGQARGNAGEAVGGVCPLLLVGLFGAAFIHVGVQSTRGTARDTLGNGVGSIILGMLNAGAGVLLIFVGSFSGKMEAAAAVVVGGISLLGGIGLVAAGVLALVGRVEYKAWRRAQKAWGPRDRY